MFSFTEELHTRPCMVTKGRNRIQQNISIGSFHASSDNFHNVSMYVKYQHKLVMVQLRVNLSTDCENSLFKTVATNNTENDTDKNGDDDNTRTVKVLYRVFHKLCAMQECQYCQLRFSCASRNEQDQESLLSYNIICLYPLISNFTFTNSIWCK